jgi:hypothetical protein
MTDESGRFRRRFLRGAGAAAATALAGCAGGGGGSADGSTPTDQGGTPEGTETQTDEEVSGTPTDTEGTGGQEQTATQTEEFSYGGKSPAAWAMGMQPSTHSYGNLSVGPKGLRSALDLRAADMKKMDSKGSSESYFGLGFVRDFTPFDDDETMITASDEIAYRWITQLTPEASADVLKKDGWEEVESELEEVVKMKKDDGIGDDIYSMVIHAFQGGAQVHAGTEFLPPDYDLDSGELSYKAFRSDPELSTWNNKYIQDIMTRLQKQKDLAGCIIDGNNAYATRVNGEWVNLFDN